MNVNMEIRCFNNRIRQKHADRMIGSNCSMHSVNISPQDGVSLSLLCCHRFTTVKKASLQQPQTTIPETLLYLNE